MPSQPVQLYQGKVCTQGLQTCKMIYLFFYEGQKFRWPLNVTQNLMKSLKWWLVLPWKVGDFEQFCGNIYTTTVEYLILKFLARLKPSLVIVIPQLLPIVFDALCHENDTHADVFIILTLFKSSFQCNAFKNNMKCFHLWLDVTWHVYAVFRCMCENESGGKGIICSI